MQTEFTENKARCQTEGRKKTDCSLYVVRVGVYEVLCEVVAARCVGWRRRVV